MTEPATFDLVSELSLPRGPFGTIIADPPWSFNDKGSRAAPDWKERPIYETMQAEDVADLPIAEIAAENAHLYLWTTDSHLEAALDVMRCWGFAYKLTLIWVKRGVGDEHVCPDGARPGRWPGRLQIGMGHYYRHAHEICLFGVRGSAPAAVRNLPTVFEAPRTLHSRKPRNVHTMAEALSPGPRVELFATQPYVGWEGWGDQFAATGQSEFWQNAIRRIRAVRLATAEAKRTAKAAAIQWNRLKPFHYRAKWAGKCGLCGGRFSGHVYVDPGGIKVCNECIADRVALESSTALGPGSQADPVPKDPVPNGDVPF